MTPPPLDLPRAHRYFAVEFNNLAWALVEDPSRDAAGTERMIHAAHAACLHWLNAGNALNHQRALCLLATAYAKADITAAATYFASRCLALSAENGDTQTIFDRATAHGCAAIANRLAGNVDLAAAEQGLAEEAAAKFDDASDRVVFDRLYPARP
jgi:hypothetical protein